MENESTSKKPFDDAFKTLSEKNSKLLIPVINTCLGKKYLINENIELLSGEHHIMLNADNIGTKEIITDTSFKIKNKLYHMECQSTPDGSMVLRMVEYDFFIALENAARLEDGIYEMTFPKSAVLYLRHNSNTPDIQKVRINFSGGEVVEYQVPIIKTQLYTVDDIIAKKLYFLIPYYILKYENIKNVSCFDDIINEYSQLYAAMKKECEKGILNEYDIINIQEFTDKIIKHIAGNNEYIRKGADNIMGGTVIETIGDRCLREGEVIGETKGRILAYHEFGLSDEEISNRVGRDIDYVRQVIADNE